MSDCRHRDDAGPWVLGALGEPDAQAFAFHLGGCDECRRQVAELQPTADVLASAAPPVLPPPELKRRIMDIVEGEAELLAMAGPAADRPAPQPSRLPFWRRHPRRVLAGALSCLALAAGIGLGAAIWSGGQEQARVVAAAQEPGGADVALRVDGDRGTLELVGMPAPPRGRIYQVWTVRGQGDPVPTRTLFTVPDDGDASVTIDADLRDVDQVLVSDEPPGGSNAPTGDVVIGARL